MKKILKLINWKALLIAFLTWFYLNISGAQDIYFFARRTTSIIIIVKILHLVFLYFIFAKLHLLLKNRHEPKVKKEIIISIIYFIILTALLFMVWPGTWSWDDIAILRNASTYKLTPWQHFFSGLFQILCLQTIPIPSGVIIIQILISSLIVGYCISNISTLYAKSKKQEIILQVVLGIILLSPPLLMYILCGFRMGLYSYIELLLVTEMMILYKKQNKVIFKDIIKISFLTIIVSCWRTEGLYYPVFILILYFILGKKVISKKASIIVFSIIMIINFTISKQNNLMIGDNDYSLTATTEPVVTLVRNSNESDKEELEAIDKVIDVSYLLENPDKTSEECFWEDGVRREYSEEDYYNYFKAYLKLAIKYPDVTFKSMWNVFVDSGSGFGEDNKQTTKNMVAGTGGQTLELYNIQNGACRRWNAVPSSVEKYKKPINLDIRNNVISFLNGTDSNGNLTIVHNISWNFFIPFILMLICLIYKIVKKDWFMVFLILAVSARIPLVFVTAPVPYFMYYLSAYLCTYALSIIVIFEFFTKLMDKKKENLKSIDRNELLVIKNKKEQIKIIFKQFISFLLVSGVGWVIDFSIYIILTKVLDFKVIYANILSSIPAITYVFLMSNKKIFKNIDSKLNLKTKYLIYFGYQLILLLSISLLGEFLYDKLIDFITIPVLVNNFKIVIKILITPITMTLNFVVMKNLIEKL